MGYTIDVYDNDNNLIGELEATFNCTELDTDYIDGNFEFEVLTLYSEDDNHTVITSYEEACAKLGAKELNGYLDALWDVVDTGELHQDEMANAGCRAYDEWKDSLYDN